MKIGLDAIAFSTSKYFLKLSELAAHRGVDYAKYCVGIGQKEMSVFPPKEDIITLAVSAAEKVVKQTDAEKIDMLIFATESSVDLSKSAGIYVHRFLKLKNECCVFDVKQACYSMTAALRIAKNHVQCNPHSKVLVVGSDIVKYSPGSSGEATQGGSAVAAIVSADPRIMEIENFSGIYTSDVMDFWRPINCNEALFDGKLSAYNYLKSLGICFDQYMQKSRLTLHKIDAACFHAPFCKMAQKAGRQIFAEEYAHKNVDDSLIYNSLIGNSCSSSLFLCLISLLDNCAKNLSGKRVGLFSYGSGSVAEYFSGIISDSYRDMLTPRENASALKNREAVSFETYEYFCSNPAPTLNQKYETSGAVYLEKIENYQRIYKNLEENFS